MSSDGFLRVLKDREILALAFGAMIGWGWVVLAGHWIVTAGSLGAASAFLLGGMAIICIGLVYAELTSAMPFAGGEHVYSLRALGRLGSFVCTWAIVLGYASVVAFEAVALPTVLEYLLPDFRWGYLWTVAGWDVFLTWALVGMIGAVIMTAINIIGVKLAAVVQGVVTLLLLVTGAMFLSGALFRGSASHLLPLFADGSAGVFAVLIMVPFMFVGFDVIPQAAEEADVPFRQLGRLLLIAVLLAIIWYVLIILAVSLALPSSELGNLELGTADASAAIFGGPWAGKLLVLGGLAGIITSWNAFLVGGSRALYALAHSSMLPPALGRLHPRYRTPYNAILLIGAISFIAPLFGRYALVWLVNAGGAGIIVAYALVALSFLVLRRREPELERPFRVPAGNFIGIAALVLAIGIGFLYLPGSPVALSWPYEWAIVLGWSALGAVLFAWAYVSERYRGMSVEEHSSRVTVEPGQPQQGQSRSNSIRGR